MISNSIERKDADDIINSINNLINITDKDKYQYLNALLNPERSKNIKIPSKIPIPSCTVQLHETKILNGNNFRIMFNPFFLYDKRIIEDNYFDTYYGPYGEENYGRIDSSEYIGFYQPIFFTTLVEIFKESKWREDSIQTRYIDINQGLPHLYSKYRLVSASITVKYVGSMETSNGIIGGAIITEDNNYVSSHMKMIVNNDNVIDGTSQNRMFYKYYDYNLVLNSLYHQQNKCIDGIRLIYFPLDNSYEEFVDVFTPKNVKETGFIFNYKNIENAYLIGDKNFKNAFNFYIYILNDFGSDIQNKYKLDVYCNFECLPFTEYINLLPINLDISYVPENDKKNIIEFIQNKPVMKLNEVQNILNWKQSLKQLKRSKEFIQDKQYDFKTKLLKQNDEEIKQEEKKDDEEMKQEKEMKEEKKDDEETKEEEKKDDKEVKQEEKKDNEEMEQENI